MLLLSIRQDCLYDNHGGVIVLKNRIREFRKQMGLTLYDLAKMTNISPGYLCHLEKGTRTNPSSNVMNAISKALKRNVYEVFFDIDQDDV